MHVTHSILHAKKPVGLREAFCRFAGLFRNTYSGHMVATEPKTPLPKLGISQLFHAFS
jgi:hypothetical protein